MWRGFGIGRATNSAASNSRRVGRINRGDTLTEKWLTN
jgi:hypothetical protein